MCFHLNRVGVQLVLSPTSIWFIEINCIEKYNGIIRQRATQSIRSADAMEYSEGGLLVRTMDEWCGQFYCLRREEASDGRLTVHYVHGALKRRLFGWIQITHRESSQNWSHRRGVCVCVCIFSIGLIGTNMVDNEKPTNWAVARPPSNKNTHTHVIYKWDIQYGIRASTVRNQDSNGSNGHLIESRAHFVRVLSIITAFYVDRRLLQTAFLERNLFSAGFGIIHN